MVWVVWGLVKSIIMFILLFEEGSGSFCSTFFVKEMSVFFSIVVIIWWPMWFWFPVISTRSGVVVLTFGFLVGVGRCQDGLG